VSSSHRGIAYLIVAAILVFAAAPALAQQGDPPAERIEQPAELAEPPVPDLGEQVRWKDDWDKVRSWQYPTSVGLMTFGFASRFALPDPEPNWQGTFELEQDLVDLIAVRDDPARSNLIQVTDLTFYGAMGYRIFDSALIPGFAHDNWEVAWQMSWIDFQAFSVVAAVLWGSQLFIGRVRPTSNNCDDPDRPGNICDPDHKEYARSFIAGHPATAITAAGLTCVHHARMPLYGGGLADDLACGAMITNAVVGSAARIMTEHHYPSDLLFGTVLGLTAGWILPTALHYGWDDDDPAETARLPKEHPSSAMPVFTLAPSMVDDRPGLMMLGRF
jgi:membrane-associated phospholipid phosphatase